VREGDFWTEKLTGEMPSSDTVELRVWVRGKVTLLGSAEDKISYVYTRRMRARDAASAKRTFASQQLRLYRNAGRAHLTLQEPPWNLVFGDLVLNVPAAMKYLIVETQSGDIDASGIRGGARLESGDGNIYADNLRGSLMCRTAGGNIRLGRIDGHVRCITGGGSIQAGRLGTQAWLETGAGEITVDEVIGPLDASSGAGNVLVAKAGSTVSARTLGGSIRVLDARGAVKADNAGGPIQINSAKHVRLESAAGPIRLFGVSGELQASTMIGNILAELMGGKLLDSYLSTGSGDITVLIPSNLAVRIQAFNESAMRTSKVLSEFPEIRLVSGGAADSRLIAAGELNGGGPLLRIAASGGTVYLRRQK
jgi:hypothetical protein